MDAPRRQRGRVRVWLALAAVTSALAACSGSASTALSGEVFVAGPGFAGSSLCVGDPSTYEEYKRGLEVTVLGPDGATLAMGELADGRNRPDELNCALPFTVNGVPTGVPEYRVLIGSRIDATHTEADLSAADWRVEYEVGLRSP